VWVPQTEVDERAVNDEIGRIIKNHREKRKGKISNDIYQILGLMKFAKYAKILKDICIFTGKPGHAGVLEDGAKELVMVIEEMIYGPPPPNYTLCPFLGFAKGLPGESSAENSVNGPSWIAYPANSIIFSQKHNIPLVNDHHEFSMPFVPTNTKSNAQVSIQKIQKETKFIVDTTIRPAIQNVKRVINDARKS